MYSDNIKVIKNDKKGDKKVFKHRRQKNKV